MAKFCTHCGHPLRGNEKFCTNCGKELRRDAPKVDGNAHNRDFMPVRDEDLHSKDNKRGLILIVGSVVALVVILIMFLTYNDYRVNGSSREYESQDSSCVEVVETEMSDWESPGHVPLSYFEETECEAVEPE